MIFKYINSRFSLVSIGVATIVFSSFQYAFRGVSPEEFIATYKKNQSKFIKSIHVNEFYYSVKYVPVELKIVNLQKTHELSKLEKNEIHSTFKNYKEFLLQISVDQFTDELLKYKLDQGMDYTERVNYFSFQMKDDLFFVLDNLDTIQCSNYIFERNFGTSPRTTVTIGFETEKKYKTLEIILNDQLFDNSQLTFSYESKDMKALPKLKNN